MSQARGEKSAVHVVFEEGESPGEGESSAFTNKLNVVTGNLTVNQCLTVVTYLP